jgi:hypothetical protein
MLYDYQAARRRYLPSKGVKVLFIGESPPTPRGGEIRFFYHPVLRPADNLFRGLMLALYGADKRALAAVPKIEWLKRFQRDGYYLDDLSAKPINDLTGRDRAQARRAAVDSLLERIHAVAPWGIIICHLGTYDLIANTLQAKRLPVLHVRTVPFPSRGRTTRFAEAVRAALAST